ncbi:MAG: hypothetical protein WD078_07320 [Woeseia sp.]
MDKLDRQLKDDAAAIDAQVTPALRLRIDASLRGVRPASGAAGHLTRRRWRLGPLGGLAGVAAAGLLLAVLLRQPETPPEVQLSPTPAFVLQSPPVVPLTVRQAGLTQPLRVELESLQADLEKVRETVERDLGVTL